METRTLKNYLYSDWTIISVFFIAKILFHLLHPEYGYFRDELFYIAIADNFSFSNLDVLPLTPLYLKLITFLFGYAIKTVHFASALCGAFSIAISCLITRELGGKKYAILFTGLTVFFSGFIIFGGLFTYDSLDFLIWVSSIYILVRIITRDQQKLWLLFGLITGLGFLNKLTISFFGLAIAVALLLSPHRTFFKKKWIWIGAGISLLFTIPFLIWQFQQNWYFIGVAAGYAGGIAYIASFPEFIWNQLLPNNLINFPLWITGLLLLLFSSRWKSYRFFGYGYFLLFFMFYFAGAKFYFLVPYYAILLAVGSIKF
jgi:4-amino-4-deoxy-L-arabinose transferase-like glycosyltransferase